LSSRLVVPLSRANTSRRASKSNEFGNVSQDLSYRLRRFVTPAFLEWPQTGRNSSAFSTFPFLHIFFHKEQSTWKAIR
jgi:hypothetical protein